MNSHITARFRRAFADLPTHVQDQAREAYRLFQHDSQHPSLRFRQVNPTRPIYSARVNISYRVVGIRDADTIVWFWIGNHDDYERLLAHL